MIACLFKRGRKWQAKVMLSGWQRERRISLGTTDKRVAQLKLGKLVVEFEKEAAGLLPPASVREARQRPLAALCDGFLADLTARGKPRSTVKKYAVALGKLRRECSWLSLADVSQRSFCEWRTEAGLHPKTSNDYLNVWMRLFRWLKRQRLVAENPLEYVEAADTRRASREYRRALTTDDVRRLLSLGQPPASSESGDRARAPENEGAERPAFGRKAGGASTVGQTIARQNRRRLGPLWTRLLVYRLILETGLRHSELKGLRWSDMVLDGPSPCVRVPASIAKNAKTALLVLGAEMASGLRSHRPADFAPFGKVFAAIPRGSTFRRDLVAAGIPFVDESGRRVDLHSLRKTFGTALVLSGVEPRVVMEAMRHSDLKLTMKTYMDAAQLQGPVAAAVAKLPWHADQIHERIQQEVS